MVYKVHLNFKIFQKKNKLQEVAIKYLKKIISPR